MLCIRTIIICSILNIQPRLAICILFKKTEPSSRLSIKLLCNLIVLIILILEILLDIRPDKDKILQTSASEKDINQKLIRHRNNDLKNKHPSPKDKFSNEGGPSYLNISSCSSIWSGTNLLFSPTIVIILNMTLAPFCPEIVRNIWGAELLLYRVALLNTCLFAPVVGDEDNFILLPHSIYYILMVIWILCSVRQQYVGFMVRNCFAKYCRLL